ncbi:MAG: XamI family restriction endonuclease [Planctomycetota bacterium]|nr:MAG: XamI family restriction endonuclease [Planctomycetota bacterium]
MAVNRDKPDKWKKDIAKSVDLFNKWFMNFAPKTFRESRVKTTKEVAATLKITDNLINLKRGVLKKYPGILPTLRMCTCPPLARDRLVGLAQVSKSMIVRMEKKQKLPAKLKDEELEKELKKITKIISKMADYDILPWLEKGKATPQKVYRAATIIADRFCGAVADPLIRNAQEARQLDLIGKWLKKRGYKHIPPGTGLKYTDLKPGFFSFRLIVPVRNSENGKTINIPVDAVVKPRKARAKNFPLLIEAKSAGDFANVNKRRKEEAKKVSQLRETYGKKVQFILFLCGYFDSGYLGYEAAEGIDWVWEHRINDLAQFGL